MPESLPTKIKDESKEFWEGLNPEEKEAMKSRHRSVAQLKRHSAEVTEEGRLEVTKGQGERARKEMGRELRKRGEGSQLLGRERQPSLGERIENLGKRLGVAVSRWGERIEHLAEEWRPKIETLIERGRRLGIEVRQRTADLIELPAKVAGGVTARKAKTVEELKRRRDEDVAIYEREVGRYQDDFRGRTVARRQELDRRLEDDNRQLERRRRQIDEKYGDAWKKSGRTGAQRTWEFQVLGEWWGAQKEELEVELAEFLAQEQRLWEEWEAQLKERYSRSLDPTLDKLDKAITERDKWQGRMDRSREAASKIRVFLSLEKEE